MANQRNNNRAQKSKCKTVKAQNPNISIGIVGNFLTRLGEWSTGITAICAPLIWFWFHPAWAFWTSLIALPIVVFAVCRRRKWSVIPSVVVVGATAGISILVALFFPPTPKLEKQFTVVCKRSFINTRDKFPYFWFVDEITSGIVAYPIHVAMQVVFTNLKPTPMVIDHYWVETKVSNDWRGVYSIDVREGDIFVLNHITNAMRLRLIGGNSFNAEIEGKAIMPHTPVIGMIFMEMPKNGIGTNWRFRVKMADGAEFHQPITFGPKTPDGDAPIIRLGFEPVEERDLTKAERRFYHEE